LAVEALVASIPIQVGLSCISRLNFMPLWGFFEILIAIVFRSVEGSPGFHHYPCYIPTCWRDPLHFCCCCCPTCWGNHSPSGRFQFYLCMPFCGIQKSI
jgi:hypothetical protein